MCKRAATSGIVIAMSATGAIILLGFTGAFRRSELVALDVADLEEAAEGPWSRWGSSRLPPWPRMPQLQSR